MLDLFNKKALAEAQIKIANAEAKAEANSKKFKTAVIAGSSTTGAAVAAIAAHFVFGNGRKLNRDKIKNFDQVVEERDRIIGEKAEVEAALKGETALRNIAIADADSLSNAINSGDPNQMVQARDNHYKFRKEIYGDITAESLKNSIEMFNHYIKELEKTQVQPQVQQEQPQVQQEQPQVQQEQPQVQTK